LRWRRWSRYVNQENRIFFNNISSSFALSLQLQINAGLAEGRTPQELANAGLSGAIEPKVLK